ncbi:MerR family transcriptional regulator [Deinococcus sp. MIMF12]|uniref:MerR family transcriptional regulator n=1 Tax=Deinococcus rhizophilus TaxID=3049544 RepID=A0ABT7JD04_9DEIO|nr:MerR family transcriptional regulator [Deinococcus rhizophilus]MDL2342912.1 MerR family transcriptional regulator [Deinococcus rhizophilus]
MTDTQDPLSTDPLSIGAFARASRLSQRALRLYDDLGLLPPARVDPDTGYRFYTPAQIGTARLIGLLRTVEMPLADIRALLGAPLHERAGRVEAHWAEVQALHLQRAAVARHLIHTLRGDPMPTTYEVQSRDVPAQTVLTVQRRVLLPDLSALIGRSLERLHAELRQQGAETAGPPVVIYHGEVGADSDGPVEVGVPYRGQVQPGGDLTAREEPAHTEAFVTVCKADFEYHELMAAYDAVNRYIRAHGTRSALSVREVYPYGWEAAGPGDPAGEVACPFVPGDSQ